LRKSPLTPLFQRGEKSRFRRQWVGTRPALAQARISTKRGSNLARLMLK
jgi:hypothetical protein